MRKLFTHIKDRTLIGASECRFNINGICIKVSWNLHLGIIDMIFFIFKILIFNQK